MLTIDRVRGAIFDVDETLLDTGAGSDPVNALHERARLQAVREAGKRHKIPALATLTPEANLRGFYDAPVHSLEGAVWHILYTSGVVTAHILESGNHLLREIVARKDELFEDLLRTEGKAFPGAVEFVEWLSRNGIGDRLAIASTAIRRDIDIFLGTSGLHRHFPEAHKIISKDDVTHAKPHPEAFDKAFLTLGLPESDRPLVLAFEDNPRGIMAAKGAGLYTCAFTSVYSKEHLAELEVAPDLIADSFDEFREALQQPLTTAV